MKKVLFTLALSFTANLVFAASTPVNYEKKCLDQFNKATSTVATMAEGRVYELEEDSHAVTWVRELTETGDEVVALKKAVKTYCQRMKGLN